MSVWLSCPGAALWHQQLHAAPVFASVPTLLMSASTWRGFSGLGWPTFGAVHIRLRLWVLI
ncbi:MAG TPA: hypothetical protein DEA94_15325 [Rhodobacteraceae bacterium]|nr:hypothetical protein [Paracoccaceae bacterium]